MPKPKGTLLPASASLDILRAAVSGGLGDANNQVFGLGDGELEDGSPRGTHDAVIAWKVLAAGDDTSAGCAIPHALGRVPRTVRLLQLELSPGQDAVVALSAKNRSGWTSSQVLVRIATVAGSIAGTKAVVIVGG